MATAYVLSGDGYLCLGRVASSPTGPESDKHRVLGDRPPTLRGISPVPAAEARLVEESRADAETSQVTWRGGKPAVAAQVFLNATVRTMEQPS